MESCPFMTRTVTLKSMLSLQGGGGMNYTLLSANKPDRVCQRNLILSCRADPQKQSAARLACQLQQCNSTLLPDALLRLNLTCQNRVFLGMSCDLQLNDWTVCLCDIGCFSASYSGEATGNVQTVVCWKNPPKQSFLVGKCPEPSFLLWLIFRPVPGVKCHTLGYP